MSNRPGWIKLYNQTLDSDFWLEKEPFDSRSAFLHVLIAANWRKGVTHIQGTKLTIERGQWLTSIRKLAAIFHWSVDRVYKWLEIMADHNMLTRENVRFGTLLTVVNYDKYQCDAYTQQNTQQNTEPNTQQNTDRNTEPTQSKTIRLKTEDSVLAPPAQDADAPPEDNDEGDDPEEAWAKWISTHSEQKTLSN